MRPIARKGWISVAAILMIASAATLTLLTSGAVFHSFLRAPLSDFVQPGVILWWFALGGPFRDAPASPAQIAFAAMANTVVWLLVLWTVAALARLVYRALAGSSR